MNASPEPAAPPVMPSDQPSGPPPLLPTGLSSKADSPETPSQTLSPGVDIRVDREPPILWQSWIIAGRMSASQRDTLRGFFAPEMSARQSLGEAGREELKTFARSIGYDLEAIRVDKLGDGSNQAVLELAPMPMVRRVDVVTPFRFAALYRFDTIFADEITRRMRLRPGAFIEREPARRKAQLDAEAERVADYLRTDGFFEARVTIIARLAGPSVFNLKVTLVKGPRYEIGRISVSGNESVPSKEIVDKFRHGQLCVSGFCLIERFSLQNLNKDIEKVEELYRKRGFPAVRVTTDFSLATSFNRLTKKVDFTVIIYERRKIDVIFEGNDPQAFPAEALEALLTFNTEGSYDDVEVENSVQAIRRFYQSRGYFEATVTVQRERFSFFERIVFTIDAGPRLRVREVSFRSKAPGMRLSLSTATLAGVVRISKERSSALFGSDGGFAISEQIDVATRRLERLYREQGFADVEVTPQVLRSERVEENAATLAAVVASGAATGGLYVRFLISEGERTTIENVSVVFEGQHQRSADTLRRVIGMAAGEPYTDDRVIAGKSNLERYYFENARPHAQISWQVRDGSAAKRKQVVYTVNESHVVRFGKVLVRGNFKTENWVILDELDYREGAPLTLGRAEVGQQNLRSSSLFNAVQVAFVNLDKHNESDVNVLVMVEERHDHTLSGELAGGKSSENGWYVEAAVFNHNILGKGLRVDLRGHVGEQLMLGEIKLIAPRWAVRRAVSTITGGLLQFAPQLDVAAFIREDKTERFGDLESRGASVAISRLGRRGFFRGWLLSLRYDFRQRTIDEDLLRSVGASDDISQEKVDISTGTIGPQLIIDKRKDENGRENPLTPSRGFKLELRAIYADRYLLGQHRFVKLGVGLQHFYRPWSRLLVTNGLRYDHGVPLGQVVLPEVERFFSGGDTTVRGFEEDRLATEIIEEPVPPLGEVSRVRILPAGGNIRAIHNLDFQFDVWKLGGSAVASAVFLDTGLVTNSLNGFELGRLRHSVGIALFRWVGPFGAISFEWAMPLDPQLGDNPRGRFHFNFGLLF